MKTAFFDCFSGISGDMCLGALIDAGVPLNVMERELKRLPASDYTLGVKKVRRAGIAATKVDVVLKAKKANQKAKGKTWKDIDNIIRKSAFSDSIKKKGKKIFRKLFEAEARVHGEAFRRVHLHELGGTDCLVDIFGTLIGLELLGIERIYSSPINVGSGSVKTEHGILPVPAPATAELLMDVPVYSSDIQFELTTPTGAAIVKTLSNGFGNIPLLIPEKIGLGAGARDFKERPNVLRILIGETNKQRDDAIITVIETNIDDMNPQIHEYLFEKLLENGALDVYLTQIMMKKTRPGIKLTVLCNADKRDSLIHIILKETTTIGVRYYETNRVVMDRESKYVRTKYGKVKVKYSRFGNSISKNTPEYEYCREIAGKKGIPLIKVIDEARKACRDQD